MNQNSDLLLELKQRGFVAQMTHPEELETLLNKQKITVYAGFDPSADSLTMGHLLPILLLAHLQRFGHQIIAVAGGGTMMVGDPTGKTEMREILSPEKIDANLEKIKLQLSRLLNLNEPQGRLLNNADWLLQLNYMETLRELGPHFSVNQMLHADCFKSRMEKGLSFLELNYMIMQSYDFLYLNQKFGCSLQIGGDDQWSNMLFGADLIRKKARKSAYALTIPLLCTSDGVKMGKTAKGAIWLDSERTPPFDFYQYLRNTADEDVIKYLKVLTFLPLSEIARFEKLQGADLNEAKKVLAFEVTQIIHGQELALKVSNSVQAAFGAHSDFSSLPTFEVDWKNVEESTQKTKEDPNLFKAESLQVITNLLVKLGIYKTKSDVRRLIEQKGLRINNQVIDNYLHLITEKDFSEGQVLIQGGKKHFYRLMLKK